MQYYRICPYLSFQAVYLWLQGGLMFCCLSRSPQRILVRLNSQLKKPLRLQNSKWKVNKYSLCMYVCMLRTQQQTFMLQCSDVVADGLYSWSEIFKRLNTSSHSLSNVYMQQNSETDFRILTSKLRKLWKVTREFDETLTHWKSKHMNHSVIVDRMEIQLQRAFSLLCLIEAWWQKKQQEQVQIGTGNYNFLKLIGKKKLLCVRDTNCYRVGGALCYQLTISCLSCTFSCSCDSVKLSAN